MTMTDLSGWRGHDVVDPSGDRIGEIADIYLDEQTDQPEWLAVRTGLFGRRLSFVPLAEAQPSGDYVAVPYSKDQVKDAPHVDPDGGLLSEAEEARLYEHYGLPYSDIRSDTGLPDGGGTSAAGSQTDDAMTRSEEELQVGTREREAGRARLRKWVETEHVTTTVPVAREEVRIEREPITDTNVDRALQGPEISESEYEVTLREEEAVAGVQAVPKERVRLERQPAGEADSGEVEVLPDGSISIPVFQEELVIEKRLVVRERVIVRKHTVTEDRLVEADLRRERVEVDVDPEIAGRVTHEEGRSWGSVTGDEATIQGGAA